MKEKLMYLKDAQFHPFASFYEIRFRDKGSVLLATLLLVCFGLVQCARCQYTGFVINTNNIQAMNSISIFISWISTLLLFTISNWTVTTLFDGKGKVKDIYIMLCYSLTPLIFTQLLATILSNFIIKDEAMIIQMFIGIGVVWFVFLAISGLCVIHEYTLSKIILSLFATALATAIIIFIVILFLTLEEKMVEFIISVVKELLRRFR